MSCWYHYCLGSWPWAWSTGLPAAPRLFRVHCLCGRNGTWGLWSPKHHFALIFSSKSSKCVSTNSALFQSNLNDPNEHRKYSSMWHEVSLKFKQLHLKTNRCCEIFGVQGSLKMVWTTNPSTFFFQCSIRFGSVLSCLTTMSVATKSTLDHRGAEGKDWLVGPIAVGVPKCSFLFLVNSRKLNPGSLKYVFLYVYIYTLICISYVSICSIGTGWNDNVHLSGCVCVCAIMTLMEETGTGCIWRFWKSSQKDPTRQQELKNKLWKVHGMFELWRSDSFSGTLSPLMWATDASNGTLFAHYQPERARHRSLELQSTHGA